MHDEAAGVELKVLGGHSEQVVLPGERKEPRAQQAPVPLLLLVPSGHGVQKRALDPYSFGLNVFAGHALITPVASVIKQ